MDDRGYHVTNEVLWQALERLRVEVGDLRTDVKVGQQAERDAREDRQDVERRLGRLEARLNGVFVGIGTGIVVAVWFLLREVLI